MIQLTLRPQDDIQARLDGYPFNEPIHLVLEPGTYRQKLRLKHDHLVITGHSRSDTVLVYGDYALKIHEDGKLYNTFRTPTVTIYGNDVELRNLSVVNDAGPGSLVGQAVALSLYGDDIRLFDCGLHAHQDTLFCGPLPVDLTIRYRHFLPPEDLGTNPTRHYFERCLIEGDVDFIFGGATAWFRDCEILASDHGYLTAPSTPESVPYGLVFTGCRIRNVGSDPNVRLGRPWRDYGATLFLDCSLEGDFAPERWNDWEKPHCRFFEHPYVPAPLSADLGWEEAERVRSYLAERFTRSGIIQKLK